MEGALPADEVLRAARAALQWSFDKTPDLVLISGDITDTGDDAEWLILRGLIDALPPSEAGRILIVPGNHDLTITLETYPETDGRLILAHEQRCRSFARHVLGHASPDWAMSHGDRWIPLREILERCDDYARAYDRMPPRQGSHREQWSQLGKAWRDLGAQFRHIGQRFGDGTHDRRPRNLRDFVPPVIVPDELATEAARHRGTPWPTFDRPLYRDLLELVYPIILYENAQYVVIGLNSNTAPALSILDGAIGMLGRGQLERLEQLLQSRPGKCAIVAVHHHLGCPPEVLSQMRAWNWDLKVLQLADTARLRRILARHASVVVFHGHKHIGYWADLDGIHVVSAPSVAHGNRVGTDNCYLYTVGPGGEVSLGASTRISAKPV
jgi:predicted phosphodiesterase